MNGYKMKLSIIFGIIHMAFGISLSAWNKVIKRKYMHILLEVVPQIVFLMFMFGYLVFLMFFKWVNYSAKNGATGHAQTHSEHCAPNLLITFINMCMFKSDTPDEELNKICKLISKKNFFMYIHIMCWFHEKKITNDFRSRIWNIYVFWSRHFAEVFGDCCGAHDSNHVTW